MFTSLNSLELFKAILEPLQHTFVNTYPFLILQNAIYSYIEFLIVTLIITTLYKKEVNIKSSLFSSAILTLVSQGPLLLISKLNPAYHILFTFYPPYMIFVFYFLELKVLKVEQNRALMIPPKFYYVMIIEMFLYYLIQSLAIYLISSQMEHRYVISFLCKSMLSVVTIVISIVAYKIVKKKKLWLKAEVHFSELFPSPAAKILKDVIIATLIYWGSLIIVGVLNGTSDIALIVIVLSVCCVLGMLFLGISYLRDKKKFIEMEIKHKSLHVNSLISSIDKFRGVKHDLYNIMQVYDGYMYLEDYEKLKEYHDKVYYTTKNAGDLLEISERMEENPALYSLLISKSQEAAECGAFLNLVCTADASQIDIHPLDLSKTVGILLDNAIEESNKTENKTIHFSTENTPEGDFLISISNSTTSYVDNNLIFEDGYTTKEDHLGKSLTSLLNFVISDPRCRLNVEYFNNVLTFYYQLPNKKEIEQN